MVMAFTHGFAADGNSQTGEGSGLRLARSYLGHMLAYTLTYKK